jgi:hypothetical protein
MFLVALWYSTHKVYVHFALGENLWHIQCLATYMAV